MSSLDDLFNDIKEDLEQLKEEEESVALPNAVTVSKPPIQSKSIAAPVQEKAEPVAKRPRFMPSQLTTIRKEVVTASAPVLNKDLQQSKPVASNPILSRRSATISSSAATEAAPPPLAQNPRPSPPAPSPSPPVPVPVRQDAAELVFQPSTVASKASATSTASKEAGSTSAQLNGLFIGNLGPEVRDDHLLRIFKEYPSLVGVKAVMEHADKCKGYGFAYFSDPFEMLRAMREKDTKLCGVRPMQIKRAKGERETKGGKKGR